MNTKQNFILKITSLLLVIFLTFGNVAQASAFFSSTVAETTRQVTVIEKDFDASTEVPRSNQIQGAYDWYVDAVNGSDGNDGSEGSPFKTIQKAITTAIAGQSVFVADGTYTETLYIDKDIHITGASRDGVIIDTSSSTAYGVDVYGDLVTSFENLTIIGPASNPGSYGLKIAGDDAETTVTNVLIKDSARTGLDLNGLNQAVITDVVLQNNVGNGLSLTDCSNVTVTSITTSGNTWGGVAVYTGHGAFTPGADNISIVGANSFGEPVGFYTQVKPVDPILPTNLNLPDFAYTVVNNTDRLNFTFYATDQANAVQIANGMTHPAASFIRDIATSELLVFPGMSIQAAIDGANPGDTVLVAAGTYDEEDILINKGLNLMGAANHASIIAPTGTEVDKSTIKVINPSGDVLIDGFTFNNPPRPNNGATVLISGETIPVDSATVTVSNNIINGAGEGEHEDYGLYGQVNNAKVIWEYNTLNHLGANSLMFEQQFGTSIVRYNEVYSGTVPDSSPYFSMVYGDKTVTTPQIVENNTISLLRTGGEWTEGISFCTSPTYQWYGSTLYGHYTDIQIRNNTILTGGPDDRGIGIADRSAGHGKGTITGVVIEGNTITGQEPVGENTVGVILRGDVQGAIITGKNTFTNLATGVRIREQDFGNPVIPAIPTGTIIENNTINTSVAVGVNNDNPVAVDASPNYWGTPIGPSPENLIGQVIYQPYWINPEMTILSAPPVINVTQGTEFWKIQPAIDAANAGDVIQVSAGIYAEQLVINKSLTLRGPNYEKTGFAEDRGAEAIIIFPNGITGEYPTLVKVQANDVTIEGFTFQDNDEYIRKTSYHIRVYNFNNFIVRNNIINGTYRGIHREGASIITGWLIEGNLIDGGRYVNTFIGHGISIEKVGATIQNNHIINHNIGIKISPSNNTVAGGVIQNNTVSAGHIGLYHYAAMKGSSAWIYSGNTISVAPNDRSEQRLYLAYPLDEAVDFYAIYIYSHGAYGTGELPVVTFTGNIADLTKETGSLLVNTIGIQIQEYSPAHVNAPIVINENSFTNYSIALKNTTDNIPDISRNYWGTEDYPVNASDFIGPFSLVSYYADPNHEILVEPGVYNQTKQTYHFTIQEAIDAAEDNNFILVPAGTYVENVDTGDRIINGLTVQGVPDPNGDYPLVKGSMKFGIPQRSDYGQYDHKNLILENFRIEANLTDTSEYDYGNDVKYRHALMVSNFENAQLRNLELVGTEPDNMTAITYGITVGAVAKDYTIDSVTIENFELGVYGRADNLTIQNSDISHIQSGVNIMSGENLVITGSSVVIEVTDKNRDFYVVRFAENGGPFYGTGLNISNSTLEITNPNNYGPWEGKYMRSLVLRANAGGELAVSNSNIPQGINNIASVPITADGNWWGSADKPVADEDYTGLVNFCSWLDAPAPGGQLLGDGMVTNQRTGQPYCSIQEAINDAIDDDVLLVGPGTYVENIVIDKPLTLSGSDKDAVILLPAIIGTHCTSGAGSLCEGASNIILVEADNVTIHDMTIDGNNPDLDNPHDAAVVNGEDIDARNGIITNHVTKPNLTGLEIYNTVVKNIFLRGIYMSTNGEFDIHDNIVTNVAGESASIGLFAYGAYGKFTNNTVSLANDAISANHSKGIEFVGNTVNSSGTGIHTDNSKPGADKFDLIQHNTINCGANGYGIFTFAHYQPPKVLNNTLSGCAVGVSAWGGRSLEPVIVKNNTIDGQNVTGSVGLFVTTSIMGWGYLDVNVEATGNTFVNNATAVEVTADDLNLGGSWELKNLTLKLNLNNMDLTNSLAVDAENENPVSVEASGNWWGSAEKPVVNVNYTGLVSFCSWLDAPTPFGELIGDGMVTNQRTGQFYCSIQAAVNEATAGDVLVASAGTFAETIVIDKPLTLNGPNVGINPNTGTRSAEAIIEMPQGLTAHTTLITIVSDDVVVDGFTIDGQKLDVAYYGSGIRSKANRVTISNNIVKNFNGMHIYAQATYHSDPTQTTYYEDVLVNDNRIFTDTDPGRYTGYASIYMQGTQGVVTGNVVEGRAGIQIQPYTNQSTKLGVVENNTITAFSVGIYYNYDHTGGKANWDIKNNTITMVALPAGQTAASASAIRVENYHSGGNVSITGNYVDATASDAPIAYNYLEIDGNTVPTDPDQLVIDNTFINHVRIRHEGITQPNIFVKIQPAIDNALDNDALLVGPGTYVENVDTGDRIINGLTVQGVPDANDNYPLVKGSMKFGKPKGSEGDYAHKNLVLENFRIEANLTDTALFGTYRHALMVDNFENAQLRNLELVSTESDSMLAITYGIHVGPLSKDYTIENVTIDNFELGVYGRAVNMVIKNTNISNVQSGVNIMGGRNLTITDSSIVTKLVNSERNNYVVRFGEKNAPEAPKVLDLHISNSTLAMNIPGSFVPNPDYYMRSLVLRGNAGGELDIVNSNIPQGILNISSVPITADGNWWGSADKPVVDEDYVGLVNFCTWLDDPAPDGELLGDGMVTNQRTSQYYCSIQAAIDDAEAGDVLVASAGTFVEQIVIDKAITLQGPNFEKAGYAEDRLPEAIVTYPSGIPEDGSMALVEVEADGVTIEGLTFQSVTEYPGRFSTHIHTYSANNFTVRNNIINGTEIGIYRDPYKTGYTFTDNSGWLVEGNLIDGGRYVNSRVGRGIYIYRATAIVRDNKIINHNAGIQILPATLVEGGVVENNIISAGQTGLYHNGAEKGSGAWTYRANTISVAPNDRSAQDVCVPYPPDLDVGFRAIHVINQGLGTTGELPAVTFTQNIADMTRDAGSLLVETVAVRISESNPLNVKTPIMVNENHFSNYTIAVDNTTDNNLDASYNYWGTIDATELFNSITPGSDYTPWLASGTDTDADLAGFQGDFSTLYVDDDSFQVGTIGRIQEAVNLVSGSTIYVMPGTYAEQVVIDKALTLQGPNADKAGYAADRGDEATVIFPQGITEITQRLVSVTASDVNIVGMKFEYGEHMLALFPYMIRATGVNNLTVKNNIIYGGEIGIYIYPSGTENNTGLLVEGNLIDGGPFVNSEYNRGMYIYRMGGLIQNNVIDSVGTGIQFLPHREPTGLTAQYNDIKAYRQGLYNNNQYAGSGPHKWIGNTVGVAENPRGALEMGVYDPYETDVTFRAIHVINHGLYGGTGEPPLAEFYNNILDGSYDPEKTVGLTETVAVRISAQTGSQGASVPGTKTIVYNNAFTNFDTYINNTTTEYSDANLLDASGNWWGTTEAATLFDGVTAGSDYTPWLASGTDTDADLAGFQGDFSTLYVDDDSFQIGTVGRIQEAIDMVSSSTIYVMPGTYDEDVDVNKAVNLYGANHGINPNGARTAESVIAATAEFVINATDVVVDGFTFEGTLNALTGTSIKNNIFSNTSGYSIALGSSQAGSTGDPITGMVYDFSANSFSDLGDGRLVVYLPVEATNDQMTAMVAMFQLIYEEPTAYPVEISGVDPYTYVVSYIPQVEDDTYSVVEDHDLIVSKEEGVLANDSYAGNEALTVIRVTGPTHGILTLNADGSFTYTPNADYFGEDTFTYKVSNGVFESDVATVTITVTPEKDQVRAVDDFYSVNQNAVLEIPAPGVLANDIDVDLNNQYAALVSGPSNGNLIFRNNGSFTYTPKPGFSGTDTFVYQLITTPKTQDLWTDEATVTITVIPLPVISSDDIEGPYMVGELREFNVTLTNPAEGASYTSMSASVFVDNITFADFETVEVYHPVYHTWVPLEPVVDGDGLRLDLGPTAKFPLLPGQVVTLTFRVEFNTAKEYEATGSLYCHDSGTAVEIASFTDTMVVYAWPEISSADLAGPYFIGELREFHVTLTNPANGASYTSMSASVFVDDIEPDDFETVEVYHPVYHTWVPLTPVVEGNGLRLDLGPTAKFPLLPGQVVTLTFRVKFSATGDYEATGTLYCHDSGAAVEIASFTDTMVVKARPVVSSPDIAGPYTVGVRREFHVTLTNPADGATYTNLSVSVFVDNITFDDFEKVEVLHPVYGTWVELTPVIDGDGLRLDLGPTGQFPLVPGQVVTLTFRVTFLKAGTYPAEGSLYDTSGSTPVEIASYSTTLTVNNPPNTLPEQIASAPTYVYDPAYEYVGDFAYDASSLTYTATYTAPEYLAGGAMNDLARYLGALYRQDGSTINKLTYKGVDYTWQPGTPPLAGSNWKDENGVTLVSVIVADLANQVPGNLTVTVADNFYTEDVSFVVDVYNTLDAEIASAPDYVYDPVYTYVGTFAFDDASNTYTATYTDLNYAPGAMNDLARYLGALHRQAGATIVKVSYKGVDYTWNPAEPLKGSNWEDANGITLVSVVTADFQNGLIDPATGVTFTVSDGIHTETVTFIIVINDTTAPEIVSITAIGVDGFEDVAAVNGVITVDQGYTVARTEIVLNEAVTVVEGTVVKIGTTPYGTITADGTKLTVVPYAGNEIASLPGTFAFSVPAGSVKDLAGNALVQLGATLVVNNVAPVAVTDAYTTNQDIALNVAAPGVLENDVDWTPITAVLVEGVGHGTLEFNGDGSFSYTPAAGWNGVDSFTYKANDGSADSEVVTVTITVVDNVAPELVSITAIGADGFDDVLAVGSVLTVDQGYTVARTEIVLNEAVTVEAGTVVSIGGQPYGSIVANGSLLTVTPYGSNGIASIPGTFVLSIPAGSVKDLAGNALPDANVTLVVNNVAPVAVADTYTTNQGVALNVGVPGVLENDFDWTPITAVLVTNVSHGTLTLNADGSFSYTPAANYNGTDSFTYKANDGKLYSDVTTVTITINDNVAPELVSITAIGADGFDDVVAVGSTLTVDQGYVVERTEIVLNEAVTVEPGTEVIVHGQPYGSIVADGNLLTVIPYGSNGIASIPGTFELSIPAGSVKDLAGNNLADTVVTLTVVNVAPVAVADVYTTNQGVELVVPVPGVLANDVDWTPLIATLADNVDHGNLTLNPNGSFSYTPAAGWSGVDSFSYKANDGLADSNVVTVTITVVDNVAPEVVSVTAIGADGFGDVVAVGNVITVDQGYTVARTEIVLTEAVTVEPGTVVSVHGQPYGSIVADGSLLTVTPYGSNGIASLPGTFVLSIPAGSVKDLAGNVLAEMSITLKVNNVAPVAVADAYTTNQDVALVVGAPGILSNDFDWTPITAVLVEGVGHGTLEFNGDGSFSYTPAAGWNGVDSFTYKAHDGQMYSDVTTVTITVVDNVAPELVSITAIGADGFDDVLAVGSVITVDQGYVVERTEIVLTEAVTVEAGTVVSIGGQPYGSIVADGSLLTVTPYGSNGIASLPGTFVLSIPPGSVKDLAGNILPNANVTLVVNNVAPVAVADAFATNQGVELNVGVPGVLANDFDWTPITAVLVTDVSHGNLTLNADGSFSYTPAANYNGTDSFTYKAYDGELYSDVTTVTITINDNVAPEVVSVTAIGADGFDDVLAVGGVITVDQGYTVEKTEIELNEEVTVVAGTVVSIDGRAYGTITAEGTKLIVVPYAGNETASQPGTFAFSVPAGSVKDLAGNALLDLDVTLTVNNVAPVANDDAYTTPEDTLLMIVAPGVLANDVDWTPLTITLVDNVDNGTLTLNADGSFSYMPDEDWHGEDSFTYKVSDGELESGVATVTITVTPEKDQVRAVDDFYSVNENAVLNIAAPGVMSNDLDPDGNQRRVVLVTDVAHGILKLNADGSFVYTPKADWSGEDSFVYELVTYPGTQSLWTDEATVTITVIPLPVISSDDIEGPYMVGELREFNVTLTNPAEGASYTSMSASVFVDNITFADFETVEVYHPVYHTWVPLEPVVDGDGLRLDLGPTANFPLLPGQVVTLTFRVEFNTAKEYEATGSLYCHDSGEAVEIASFTDTMVVYAWPEISSADLAGPYFIGELREFHVTLTNPANGASYTSMSASVFVDDIEPDDFETVEVYHPVYHTWVPLTPVVEGNGLRLDLGPTAKFPLLPGQVVTLTFRVKFSATGDYDATGTLYCHDSGAAVEIASFTDTMVVKARPVVSSPDIAGPYTVGVRREFHVTLTNPADGATYTNLSVSVFVDNITFDDFEKVEVLHPVYGTWVELTPEVDGDGLRLDLGPTGQFPLVPGQVVTLTFRVTFLKAGTYPAEGSLYDTSGSTPVEIASYSTTLTVNNPPDTTAPEVVSITAIGAEGFEDVVAVGSTLTVDQGYVVERTEIVLNEAVTVEAGTVVSIGGQPYGSITAEGSVLTVVPFGSNGIASLPGTFELSIPAGSVKDLAGNVLADTVVTLIVNNVAPVANDDAYTTPEDTLLMIAAPGVLANDVDWTPLTITLVNNVGNGTLTLNVDDGSFTYTPNENWHGEDSFTYKVSDGELESEVATVTITVTPEKDQVRAVDDEYETDEDVVLTVSAEDGVLSNDIDPDGNERRAVLKTDVQHGQLTLNPDGSFEYIPNANWFGEDSFIYELVTFPRTQSLWTDEATVTITVHPVNDAPVLDEIADVTIPEMVLYSFTVTATDVDSTNLTFSLVNAPTGASINATTGVFTWTPTEVQGPGVYTFTVKVCDDAEPVLCDEQLLTITVEEVNLAPRLYPVMDDEYTIDEETELTVTFPAEDDDLPAQTLTFSLVGAPEGATINATTGVFSWTPTEAQGPGVYTFTVKVCDDAEPVLCDEQLLTITVEEVNLAPRLYPVMDDEYTIDEETELTVTFPAEDDDLPAQTLTFSLVGAPEGATINATTGVFSWTPTEAQGPGVYTFTVKVCDNGEPVLCDEQVITVTVEEVNLPPVLAEIADATIPEMVQYSFTATATDIDSTNLSYSLINAPEGAAINAETGVFSWTPTEAQGPGVYTFTVKVCDNGEPVLCDEQLLTITVEEVNLAPRLYPVMDDEYTIDEETELTVTFPAEDDDLPAQTLTFSLVGAPEGATINTTTGVFSWTPTEAQGPGIYTFTVKVCDNGDPVLCDEQLITVTVEEVNLPPVLAEIADVTIPEMAQYSFTATATDPDLPAQTLTFSLVSAPEGASIDAATGVFTWTPTEAQGPDVYEFTVKVCDNGEPVLCDEQLITLTVEEVNLPPVLAEIADATIPEMAQYSFTATATDPDLPAQTLTFSLIGAPEGAAINTTTGVFSWTPTEAQGPSIYTFTVKVCDNGDPVLCDEQLITFTVEEVNLPPVLAEIADATIPEMAQYSFTATATDPDLPAQTLTFSLVSAPEGASIDAATGVFTWTPTEAQGPDVYEFTVKVCDDGESVLCDEQLITVTVEEVNLPPVLAEIGDKEVEAGEELTFTATATDPDLPAQTLTFSLVGAPDGASVDPETGEFSWTPTANQAGDHTVTVCVSDGELEDCEEITITVTFINLSPVAVADAYTTDEDVVLIVAAPGVLENDSDPNGDAITAILVDGVEHGTLTFNADGSFVYTPEENYNGTDSFTYKASDGELESEVVTVTITINPVNDPPVAVDDAYTTAEDVILVVAAPGVLENDYDVDGDALTATLRSGVSHGTLTLMSDGSFTYLPDPNFFGTDSFTYNLITYPGTTSEWTDWATVTITVTPVNDAPVLDEIPDATIPEMVLYSFTATATDVDSTNLTFSLINPPAGATINATTGVFTWTPTEAQGPAEYIFTVKVCDDGTPVLCDQQAVTITVEEVNLAPELDPVEDKEVAVGDLLTFTVTASDPDLPVQTLIFFLKRAPIGASINAVTGVFTWIPVESQVGIHRFDICVSDGALEDCQEIKVTVLEGDVNTAPVARPDAYEVDYEGVLSVAAPGVLANDTDADGDELTAILVSTTSNGTLTFNEDGSFLYIPRAGFSGTDTFRYKANDGELDSNIVTVTITVHAAPPTPVYPLFYPIIRK